MTKISRQRRWQIRHQARGLCVACSRKRAKGSNHFCRKHWENDKARLRRRYAARKARENA